MKATVANSAADTWVTGVALCGVLAGWGVVLLRWSAIPARVPVHFDMQGHVDGYGSRDMLLLWPALATAVFVLSAVLQRYPQIYNLPVAKGARQRAECERLGTRMLRWLTAILCWFFCLIVIAGAYSLPSWVVMAGSLLMAASLVLVLAVSLVRMQRLTR